MRQLAVLGVGLVLITFWGIGLRSYLRSKNADARASANKAAVSQAVATTGQGDEPPRLGKAMYASPIPSEFEPARATDLGKNVRHASYDPVPLRPVEVANGDELEILEVRELSEGKPDFIWGEAQLSQPVWTRSAQPEIQLTIRLDDDVSLVPEEGEGVASATDLKRESDVTSTVKITLQKSDGKPKTLKATVRKTSEQTALVISAEDGLSAPSLRFPTGSLAPPQVLGLTAVQGSPEVAGLSTAHLLPKPASGALEENQYLLKHRLYLPNTSTEVYAIHGKFDGEPDSEQPFVVTRVNRYSANGNQLEIEQITNVPGAAGKKNATFVVATTATNHAYSDAIELQSQKTVQAKSVAMPSLDNRTQFAAGNGQEITASAVITSVTDKAAVSAALYDSNSKRIITGPVTAVGSSSNDTYIATFPVSEDFFNGTYQLTPKYYIHGVEVQYGGEPPTAEIVVRKGGFNVDSIGPQAFGKLVDVNKIQIRLSREVPEWSKKTGTDELKNFLMADGDARRLEILYSPTGDFTASETLGKDRVEEAKWVSADRTLTLTIASIRAGFYQVRLFTDKIVDAYGNNLGSNQTGKSLYTQVLGDGSGGFSGGITRAQRLEVSENTIVTRGVQQNGAPHIEFPEYVSRPPIKGFNANDKVETRVSRLYYYRDAHRVAQILNRKVKSYNSQAVSVTQQLADKARQQADSLTTQRMELERAAIRAAEKTRKLENELSDMQRQLSVTVQEAAKANAAGDDAAARLATLADSTKARVDQLQSEVDQARDKENQANDRWQSSEREEALAKEDQFRMESAAAGVDPGTFAPADINSVDPVAQVSISVIGEGLLHLRGPLKGINQIRIMIDQIDTPQGQVRVNVHSTQINGDEADHLEIVANRIQTYIDQARFLTVQSAEMLRKAVVHVAAMRAEQARNMYIGATQAERDQLYLHAFFGRDFIDELRSLDSEFLHTGNKLLSLHSMDVTSLSSALTLLALANNETRLAILQEFERLVQTDLTAAEQRFVQTGEGCCTERCKLGCLNCKHGPKICYFGQNGHFTSLKGFFDANIMHADTISPLQREFIKLAQIMKARLITELEYKQRVMERSVIEERLDSFDRRTEQIARERQAELKLIEAKEEIVEARSVVIPVMTETMGILEESERILSQADIALEGVFDVFAKLYSPPATQQDELQDATPTRLQLLQKIGRAIDEINEDVAAVDLERFKERGTIESEEKSKIVIKLANCSRVVILPKTAGQFGATGERILLVADKKTQIEFNNAIDALKQQLETVYALVTQYRAESSPTATEIARLKDSLIPLLNRANKMQPLVGDGDRDAIIADFDSLSLTLTEVRKLIARAINRGQISKALEEERDRFFRSFSRVRADLDSAATSTDAFEALSAWAAFRNLLKQTYDAVSTDGEAPTDNGRRLNASIKKADDELEKWAKAVSSLDAAKSIAKDSRRPLDHKKFLDMLIDDLEEKYIELMEGTRAHTANIDNYIKRLTTSLDDDFNRQFYYPAFRLVREASQFKRVEFGQTETTNVLVSNRQLGKVSPSATMEFDLPERDILIAEALDAGLAIYNDVGALINDPNMMGLVKSQMGGTATPPAGSLGGRAAVRSLLPGLQGDSAEQLLAQNAGSGPDFESNVEKLIPDPAIYKFETGTGYEIRPVIAPDGQAVVFDFNYLYRTQIREPVRADEKHLGRVRQHFIDTDVQLSNFELREVSRYVVALKAERTANGVPLLEDIPLVGALWRPLPNREKSLQQNIVMAQATIFPTLFDLMGLRWAPTVADLDPLRISNREYLVRGRQRYIENIIYDISSGKVDDFLNIQDANRRSDLYRSQESIPTVHPNGYRGRGLDYENSQLREGYDPEEAYVNPGYIPSRSADGALYLPHREKDPYNQMPRGASLIEEFRPSELAPPSDRPHISPQGAPNPTIIQTMPGFMDSSSTQRQQGSNRRPAPMQPTLIQTPVRQANGTQPRFQQPATQPRTGQPSQPKFPAYPPYQRPAKTTPQVTPVSASGAGTIVPADPIRVGAPAGAGPSGSSW